MFQENAFQNNAFQITFIKMLVISMLADYELQFLLTIEELHI